MGFFLAFASRRELLRCNYSALPRNLLRVNGSIFHALSIGSGSRNRFIELTLHLPPSLEIRT